MIQMFKTAIRQPPRVWGDSATKPLLCVSLMPNWKLEKHIVTPNFTQEPPKKIQPTKKQIQYVAT